MNAMSLRHVSTRSLRFFPLAALFVAAVYAETPATTPSATKPSPADALIEVTRGDLSLSVPADGWFAPVDPAEIRVRPKVFAGELKIRSIVAAGSAVKKGDVVLALDSEEITRQIAAAENDYFLATANLVKAEADLSQGEQADALAMKVQQEALDLAARQVAWWEKVDGPQQLKSYELQVKAQEDSVGDQVDELDQLKAMYKSEELTNATADIVVKRAMRQLERSKIGLEMVRGRTEKMRDTDYVASRQGVDNGLQRQQQAMESLKSTQAQARAVRQAALFSARQAHDGAKRKLEDLRIDAAALTVAAPVDGVVYLGRMVQGAWQGNQPDLLREGEAVKPDQVVLTICPAGRMQVLAAVSEEHVARLKQGDVARITPVALGEAELSGACQSPSRVAGEGGKYEVRIEVAAVDPRIGPGHKAAVSIDIEDAKGVLKVPVAAVSRGRVRTADGTRDVVTGRSDGENVEIVRGLSEGDRVFATFAQK